MPIFRICFSFILSFLLIFVVAGCDQGGGGGDSLPPDPSSIAPPIDPMDDSFASSVKFIYENETPIQQEVGDGAIDESLVSVLRGLAATKDGSPLSAVKITVHQGLQYGFTESREDGTFDIAVNGGNRYVISYEKSGFLPIHRSIKAPVNDYSFLPRVIMTPLDAEVSAVEQNAEVFQVVQGSLSTDEDGARQATLMIPPFTTAEMEIPGVGPTPITDLKIRATEYTIGESGVDSMPGELPIGSGYTYAVDLTVDQAIESGATNVTFNQALPFYVDNYLNFPVGGAVPVGWYDREDAAWKASENGIIIGLVGFTDNKADIDLDGDGSAESQTELEALGITEAEQIQLAQTFSEVGKSLWRVPITHFTAWDCNWPAGPPDDSEPPPWDFEFDWRDFLNTDCFGCTLYMQEQVVQTEIPITGTDFKLNYFSDRVGGFKPVNSKSITVTNSEPPSSLQAVIVRIEIAGQLHLRLFNADPNQEWLFTWDGLDGYGREVPGSVTASIKKSYIYIPQYFTPAGFEQAFGRFGADTQIIGNRLAGEIKLEREEKVVFTNESRTRPGSIGGWYIDPVHQYDPATTTLYLSNKNDRKISDLGELLESYAGDHTLLPIDPITEGEPAAGVNYTLVSAISFAPDGSIFYAQNSGIRRIDTNGLVTTIAGDPVYQGESGYSGDGGPAVLARFGTNIGGLQIAPDGSLFIADTENHVIRKIDSNGIVTTIAGTGVAGLSGDEGPASSAQLNLAEDIALAEDGSLYISDTQNDRIRVILPTGIISTVAGSTTTGFGGFDGDGGPAVDAELDDPTQIALGPDGDIVFFDSNNLRIRKINGAGIINTIAGDGESGFIGDGKERNDGDVALERSLSFVSDIIVGEDGSVYYSEFSDLMISKIIDGHVVRVSGNGDISAILDPPIDLEGLPAKLTFTLGFGGMAFSNDGKFCYSSSQLVCLNPSVQSPQSTSDTEIIVPRLDGKRAFVFDSSGNHLHTVGTLSGDVFYDIAYVDGKLSSIQDAYGNTTQIHWLSDTTINIISPDNHITQIMLNSDGFIEEVVNAENETYSAFYYEGGLLREFLDPENNRDYFEYDSLGRLRFNRTPTGSSWQLDRTELNNGYQVDVTSELGRTGTLRVLQGDQGETILERVSSTGAFDRTVINGLTETETLDSGTVIVKEKGFDTRFGYATNFYKSITQTSPAGLSSNRQETREFITEPDNIFDVLSYEIQTTLDGKTRVRSYDKTSRTVEEITPELRSFEVAYGVSPIRSITLNPYDWDSTIAQLDSRGRIESIKRGFGPVFGSTQYTYDPTTGFMDSISSSDLNEATDMVIEATDSVGKVESLSLNGLATIGLQFDSSGQIELFTPPSRANHEFDYNYWEQLVSYKTPLTLDGVVDILNSYSLDKELERSTRIDGKLVDYEYDPVTGLLENVNYSQGTDSTTYYPNSNRVHQLSSASGVITTFEYDGHRLTLETMSGYIDGSVEWLRDNLVELAGWRINGTTVINIGRDDDGLITSVGELSVQRETLNPNVDHTEINGWITDYGYDLLGELESIRVSKGSTVLFEERVDNRYASGKVDEVTETVSTSTVVRRYEYDQLNRLEKVFENGIEQRAYGYDGNYNRDRYSVSGAQLNTVATYNGNDVIESYESLTYDFGPNGDLQSITDTSNSQQTLYNYNEFGGLTSIRLPNGDLIEYALDNQQRRIGVSINGSLQKAYLYKDRFRPIATLNPNGSIESVFAYTTRHVPDYMVREGSTYKIVSDVRGSVRLVFDIATGSILQQIDYDEFGRVLNDTNPGFQPFGFAGGMVDVYSDLVRFGYRDYDPNTGRWTTPDPIHFQSKQSNLYVYVNNDPINYIDIFGLETGDWAPGEDSPVIIPPYIQPGEEISYDDGTPEGHWERPVDICFVVKCEGHPEKEWKYPLPRREGPEDQFDDLFDDFPREEEELDDFIDRTDPWEWCK